MAAAILAASQTAYFQSADACSESGGGGGVWLNSAAVYGRVEMHGIEGESQMPKVTVTLVIGARTGASATLDRSGKYCFRDIDGTGGTLIIEVENVEVGRQNLPSSTGRHKQFQQDFEIWIPKNRASATLGVVSAKNRYTRKQENIEPFEQAIGAIKKGERAKAIQMLKKIVSTDAGDFPAWTQLGSLHSDQEQWKEAEDSYQKAIAANPDFVIAMTNLGRVYLMQSRFDQAILTLLQATKLDATSARSFRLLGEAYLLNKNGTLGVEALNEAIRLDPIGMADGHLLIARLYDLAGVKPYAAREYRLFLEKVPKHPDAKKFAKYIAENPETQQ